MTRASEAQRPIKAWLPGKVLSLWLYCAPDPALKGGVYGALAGRLDALPCLSRLNGMAGRAVTDSRTGVKADPVIKSTLPGSTALCLPARSRFGEGRGGELHLDFILF